MRIGDGKENKIRSCAEKPFGETAREPGPLCSSRCRSTPCCLLSLIAFILGDQELYSPRFKLFEIVDFNLTSQSWALVLLSSSRFAGECHSLLICRETLTISFLFTTGWNHEETASMSTVSLGNLTTKNAPTMSMSVIFPSMLIFTSSKPSSPSSVKLTGSLRDVKQLAG